MCLSMCAMWACVHVKMYACWHDGVMIIVHPFLLLQPHWQWLLSSLSVCLFCLAFISPVDLPEIKGNHRKFRTLVTSYIGRRCASVFCCGVIVHDFMHLLFFFFSHINTNTLSFCIFNISCLFVVYLCIETIFSICCLNFY